VYIDDCLFFSPAAEDIDDMFVKLQKGELNFKVEDNVAGFLGIHMNEQDNGSIELTQVDLIESSILFKALELENGCPKDTPVEYGLEPYLRARKVTLQQKLEVRKCHWYVDLVPGLKIRNQIYHSPCARFTHGPCGTPTKSPSNRLGTTYWELKQKGLSWILL
jgi:hypothetical protein